MSSNNYDYLSSSTYNPHQGSSSKNALRKGSADFATSSLTSLSGYKKQWSGSQYPPESADFGASSTYSAEYRDVKRLPEQFSNLRQTFDTRGNNRIRDMISKYENDTSANYTTSEGFNSSKNLEVPKFDKKDNIFFSPKESSKFKTAEIDEKLKKYSNTVDQFSNQLENTNKMSEEIKKLKQDRRKRLQNKQKQSQLQKQKQDFSLSYSSSNLSSSYRSPTANPTYEVKQRLREDSDGFRKKKTYQPQSPYTPKDYKKTYQNQLHSVNIPTSNTLNLQKYKTKKPQQSYQSSATTATQIKPTKYQKYEYTTPTTYSSKNLLSPSNKKPIEPVQYVQVNNFILGKSLGQGKFGVVYQATHKQTGFLYAVKKVPKQIIKSHLMIDQFILELKLQTFLYHENILTLYTHFDDKTSLYLVLEYMQEGTLFTHLKKNKTLGQSEVSTKIRQIASAVKYLHENQIAHRDIKPQNIVMSHGVCKLCDFGWATICSDRRKTYCGTFDYAPPQILQGVEYDYTVDLWCLGVLTYELLVGKAPFYHISRKQTMKKILNVEKTTIEYPEYLSKNAVNFIDSLIKKDPKERLSSEKLLEHPFLKNADKPPNKY